MMNNIYANPSNSSDEDNDYLVLEAVYSVTQRPPYSTILNLSRQLKKGNSHHYVRRWFRQRRDIDREESKTERNADISATPRINNDRVPPIILHIHCGPNFRDFDVTVNHCI
ncbi:uncharacterized protein LOC111041762 isoform X2 [Myzus persicae]|nr:uncharacterized protein LOC111041762 isoform X2 [Myzus persicae]